MKSWWVRFTPGISLNFFPQLKDCWLYNVEMDNWTLYSSGEYFHGYFPGTAHQNKIYITDYVNPEVFDPVSKEWSTWPVPSVTHGTQSCLLSWQESLILLGGYTVQRVVEIFNMSSQNWEVLDSSAPHNIYGTGCAVLQNDEVLLLGSIVAEDFTDSVIYNVLENKWTQVGHSAFRRSGSALVVLGSRTFAIGGASNPTAVEEFIYSSKSWITVEAAPIVPRYSFSMIAVPSELFAHLPGGCEGIN